MDKLVSVLCWIVVGVFLVVFWPLAVAIGIFVVWFIVAAAVYKDPAFKDPEE